MTSKLTKLHIWNEVQKELKKVKSLEMKLRLELFPLFFPEPKEGTDRVDIGKGWKLKGTYKINIGVDKAAVDAVMDKLPEGFEDVLLRYIPEVNIKAYKALSPEHRKVFAQCLIMKPGTPSMEVVPPKEL